MERFIQRGRPVPDYLTPPEFMPGYAEWYDAFWELSSDRREPDAPIPRASMADQSGAFRRCMRAMDDVYLKHVRSGGLPDVPESDNDARDSFRAAMKQGPDKK